MAAATEPTNMLTLVFSDVLVLTIITNLNYYLYHSIKIMVTEMIMHSLPL